MDLAQLRKLEAAAGQVLKRYHELLRQADASQHGSPAMLAKAKFEKDWETDPAALIAEVEAEAKAKEENLR
jgi:hypothetical protein